jgi:hypothetical protein
MGRKELTLSRFRSLHASSPSGERARPERVGMEKGLLAGIEVRLEVKFSADGLKLMPELREIQDHEVLWDVLQAIKTASSPHQLRRVWARRRRPKSGGRA